jgi:CRP-like cAMP-binding protein
MNLQHLYQNFNRLIAKGEFSALIQLLMQILETSPILKEQLRKHNFNDEACQAIINSDTFPNLSNYSFIHIHAAIMSILLEIETQVSAAEKIQSELLKALASIDAQLNSYKKQLEREQLQTHSFLVKKLKFSELTAQQLIEKGKLVHYKKGTHFFNLPEEKYKMGIVLKGIVKAYYAIKKKKQNVTVTLFIMTEGAIVADFDQIFLNESSELKFECLEDCDIMELDYHEVKLLQQQYHEVCADVNKFLEAQLAESLIRIRSFVLNDGKKRVAELRDSDKALFSRVSNKDLAYFVALTPESLSRILASLKS